MHAIKLHENPKPFLGKGSYLVPITTWKAAREQIRRWLPQLTDVKAGFTSKRSYITLVKIPDEHPVILDPDICTGNETPMPLRDIPKTIKDEIMTWLDNEPGNDYPGGVLSDSAQLILGVALPRGCVKWTKDLRLLYRGDKRDKLRRKADRDRD
jgi:hypothetical protein